MRMRLHTPTLKNQSTSVHMALLSLFASTYCAEAAFPLSGPCTPLKIPSISLCYALLCGMGGKSRQSIALVGWQRSQKCTDAAICVAWLGLQLHQAVCHLPAHGLIHVLISQHSPQHLQATALPEQHKISTYAMQARTWCGNRQQPTSSLRILLLSGMPRPSFAALNCK